MQIYSSDHAHDWASLLEIECFLVDDKALFEPLPPNNDALQVLVIGDSIACGYTPDTEPGQRSMPYGCLDGLYFQAQRILNSRNPFIDSNLELVAYSGSLLTSPPADEAFTAMVELFFHSTPWDRRPWHVRGSPAVVLIALGNQAPFLFIP